MSGTEKVPDPSEALAILEEHHRVLSELIGRIDDDALVEPGTIGGGDWSVRDLIAHLEAWERLALDTLEDFRARTYPRIHERYAAAGGVDRLNDLLLKERAGWSAAQARSQLLATSATLRDRIAGITQEEWDGPPFYDAPVPTKSLGDALGRVLGSEAGLFAHAADHLDDLRNVVERSASSN